MNNSIIAAVAIFAFLISVLGIAACTIRNIARFGTLTKSGMTASLVVLVIVLGPFVFPGFRQEYLPRLVDFWPLTLLVMAIVNLLVSLYFDRKGIWSLIAGVAVVVFVFLALITRGGMNIRYG